MFEFCVDGVDDSRFVMDNKQFLSTNKWNSLNICLLCLETGDNLLDIFGKKGNELNIAVILQKHFWFEVKFVLLHLEIILRKWN